MVLFCSLTSESCRINGMYPVLPTHGIILAHVRELKIVPLPHVKQAESFLGDNFKFHYSGKILKFLGLFLLRNHLSLFSGLYSGTKKHRDSWHLNLDHPSCDLDGKRKLRGRHCHDRGVQQAIQWIL